MARAPLVLSLLLTGTPLLTGCASAAAAPGALARELTAAVAPRLASAAGAKSAPEPEPLDLDAVCAGWSPPAEEATAAAAAKATSRPGTTTSTRSAPAVSAPTASAGPRHHLPGPKTRASRTAVRAESPAAASRTGSSTLAARAEREARAALGRELRRRAEEARDRGGGKRRP